MHIGNFLPSPSKQVPDVYSFIVIPAIFGQENLSKQFQCCTAPARIFMCSSANCTEFFLIGAVCQIFTRWHHNETLTLTLKVTIIYAVKDDTKIQLHLMLYIEVISLWMEVGLKEAYTAVKQRPRTARLANDVNGTREQKMGLGGVNY